MSSHAILPPGHDPSLAEVHEPVELERDAPRTRSVRGRKGIPMPLAIHFPAHTAQEDGTNRQAELFYLQKQIQSQTPMVVVLEDGEQVEGCIEWYDRNCLKIRGRNKTIVYKSAIKYMYKLCEQGH